QFAEDRRCRQVIVDAPPTSVLSMLGLGSIGSQVLHLMHAHAAHAAAAHETVAPATGIRLPPA
ncbi:MAG TPA: hypothetical protein VF132_02470, partial [Rudaea sp.]